MSAACSSGRAQVPAALSSAWHTDLRVLAGHQWEVRYPTTQNSRNYEPGKQSCRRRS